MESPAPLTKILEMTCPDCAAGMEGELPYCASCGYGLPKLPRAPILVFFSTALYFVVGCPAGLAAIYCFTFCVIGVWTGIIPALVFGCVYWALAHFMLKMAQGDIADNTRNRPLPLPD